MAVALTYENYQKYKEIAHAIDCKFVRVWEATGIRSDKHNALAENQDYRDLVAMGSRIVPYIIHHMLNSQASWEHLELLHEITGVKYWSDSHAGMFYHQIADCLNWYLASDYYQKDDVY